MKARALPPRSRRSTRGRGRRINRAAARPAETPVAPAEPRSTGQPATELAPDETLYALGDGSDLPTIDVRADVAEAAELHP